MEGALIYEGGVARISDRADVLWHTHLIWNDVFLRMADGAIWFWRDGKGIAEIEWSIDLREGSEHRSDS